MASEILVKQGTAVCWADTTDYSATNSGIARTHQIDLTSLADTKARQGAKADLTATRAGGYSVLVGIEMDVAPTAGEVVEIYWAASYSGTAGTGNAGGASGADAAYKDGEEAEWVQQLIHIGDVVLTADAATTVQVQCVNPYFSPPTRYGMPVVKNEGGQAFEGDAVEMFVALIPVTDESQ
jgi:hypothetical protein